MNHSLISQNICKMLLVSTLLAVSCSLDDNAHSSHHDSSDPDAPMTEVEDPRDDSSRIDAIVDKLIAGDAMPGIALAIIAGSDAPQFWTKGYGQRNRELNLPVTSDTIFWLGSVSKAVMGTAIAIAEAHGHLSLDDKVQTMLSAGKFFNIDNPEHEPITWRHLVTHTSGIVDSELYDCAYFIQDGNSTKKLAPLAGLKTACPESGPTTLAGYLKAYLDAGGIYYDRTQNFSGSAPGKKSEYSNIGAALAGFALEMATSQNLAEYATENIFAPLGMHHTSWRLSDLDQQELATPYMVLDEDTAQAIPIYELATWPDGGLRSSAADLAIFVATIMNRGKFAPTGVRILAAADVDKMLVPQVKATGVFWDNSPITVNGRARPVVGHDGEDPGAFSWILFDREADVGVVIVSNGDADAIELKDLTQLVELLLESAEAMGKLSAHRQ